MRLVDHEEGLVALLDVNQARQLGNVAVHAVQAFDDDQHALEQAADLTQDGIEGGGIVVRKGAARRTGELDAFQDAVMDETIVHDQVLWPEQMTDRGYVGGVAADEDHAVLDLVECRQRLLKLTLHGPLARHQAAGRGRGAVAFDRGRGGLVDARMPGQSQVVVRGEIDVAAPLDQRGRAGHSVVGFEEGIIQSETIGRDSRHQQSFVAREAIEAAIGLGYIQPLAARLYGGRRRLCRVFGTLAVEEAAHQLIARLVDEAVALAGHPINRTLPGSNLRACSSVSTSTSAATVSPCCVARVAATRSSPSPLSAATASSVRSSRSITRAATRSTVMPSFNSMAGNSSPKRFSSPMTSSTAISESMPRS